jgi:hypothetical protein
MLRELKGAKYVFMLEVHFCSCLFFLPRCSSGIKRDSLSKRNFSHVVREIAGEEVLNIVLRVMLW